MRGASWIRDILPWLMWSLILLALTVEGMRRDRVTLPGSNPRSYERQPAASPDCVDRAGVMLSKGTKTR